MNGCSEHLNGCTQGASRMANRVGRKIETSIVDKKKGDRLLFCALIHTTCAVRSCTHCWITSAKNPETRRHRIERSRNELIEGKRRPCCWPGCPHRRPKA